MRTNLKKLGLCFIALMFFYNYSKAQAPAAYLTYIFPADSIKGFDENFAKGDALSRGFFGSEYHVFMYREKRNYVNAKYGINPQGNWLAKPGPNVINAAPCINEGFESSPNGLVAGTLFGWTIAEGSNTNSCAMGGCCPTFPSNNAWIMTTPFADTYIGTVPNSPLGGSKVLKMNDNITNKGEVVQITQTFPVTPTNALFQFAYMGVLNGQGHACCDQPYIRVTLEDCLANVLACPQVSITPPGPSCATVTATGWTTNTSGISWTPAWKVNSIDLTAYIGSCVKIKITIGDCDGWAHFGYGYVDCACLPMNITVNSLVFPAGSSAVSITSCGAPTATVTAPPGLGPYVWNGPGGSGITNNTNQTFTSTTSGQYTLTMNPLGLCAPITKTVVLQFGPNPTAGITYVNSCTTYTFTNTGSGPPSVQTFSFSGPGAPPTMTTTANQNVFNFGPTSTYTVYQTVTTPLGCKATASVVITTPAGPNPAFTASPSYTQCFNTNAFTFNATTAAGTHTYSFASPVGAPPTGFVNPYGPVSFSSAGTYTVTHTINNAGCTTAASSVVVVTPNPSVVATWKPPACPTGAGTLVGGGLGAFTWTGPGGFSSSAASPTRIPTGTAIGIYTLTSNYLGCIGTATVAITSPTAPVVSVGNNGPVCVGSPLTFTASFPPGATYFYWYSYVSSPYFYYYGGYMVQSPTIAVTTTANAQTYTFWLGYPGCPVTAYTTAVQIVSPVTPTVSNTGPYCAGQTIQLNSNGGTGSSYTWSGPSSFTSAVQNASIAASTTAMGGVYTVTTGVGSCKKTGTTTVIVNPLPVPVIGSNSPVCLGSSILLTASGGTAYAWSGPNAFTSAVQNPTITNAAIINGGVYTVTLTGAGGCKNTATVNVTVTTPTTSASNTGPYCVGATISLNTPAATTYTWTGPSAFTSNVQTPNIVSATAAMSGVYTVTSTTGGCKATSTTAVVVNPLPLPVAANTGPYCAGTTIQLNVNAFTTYSWTGPAAFTSAVQNPNIPSSAVANAGAYVVSVTDANGCTNTSTTTVVVNPIPVPVIGSNSPICLGAAINLTSGGGTTYSWSGPNAFTSAVQNPNIASAAVINGGVYTVTASALGCSSTGTVNVVIVTPTTTASNTGPYCSGAAIQLNAPAATTFTWSGPGGFTSNLQNPNIGVSTTAMGGVYTVLSSVGTCSATATTTVVVNALPIPVANSNSPVCAGQAINFTGSAAATYTWTGPLFTSNLQSPSIASAVAANAGTYTLDVTDVNGCKNNTTTNVIVNPLPIVAVTNPTNCVGTTINLTATGGATYAWSGPGGFTSAVQNPNIPSAAIAMAGVYTVTVTTAQGCVSIANANIGVTALPVPAIVSNTPCVGAALNLTGSGGTTYSWSGPNVFSSVIANPTIINATMPANGTYTLTATSGTCTASTTAVIVVNPLPTPLINTNSPVCIGQSISINGNGGVSYSWSGPGGFNSTSQNPTIPVSVMLNSGNYNLTVTDANGCVNTTNANVVVNPQPNVSASGGVACQGANTNLSASGGVTYSWSGPGGFTSSAQSPTLVNLNSGNAGIYTVLVTDANTCTNTAVVSIVVNPIPVPNIQTNSPVCLNNILSFSGSGGVSYSWSGPMGTFATGSTFTVMGSSTGYTGTYNLTVTDANGCSASTSAPAVVNPLPIPAIISSPNKGCAPLCVTFTATSQPAVSAANWIMGDGSYSNGVLTTDRCYRAAGVYTLSASVTDINGCQGTTSYTVEVYPIPTADFNHAPIKPIINIDPEVTFTDASFGANVTTWNWFFMNNGQYTSVAQNPTFMYTEPGNYVVALVVKSDKGCSDTILRPLVVGEDFGIYVPNAFTPNDDGLNDTFYPKGYGVTKYEINIFDRWGEKVFTTTDFNEAWDGTYINKGVKIIKDGTYTWAIKVTSVFGKSHELTGHVTLIK